MLLDVVLLSVFLCVVRGVYVAKLLCESLQDAKSAGEREPRVDSSWKLS